MGDNHTRQLVKWYLRHRALREGEFRLRSGATATHYLDCRRVTMSSDAARLIGQLLFEVASKVYATTYCGPATAAIPLVTAAAVVAGGEKYRLDGLYVRDDSKGHGTGAVIEGNADFADRILLIDDVVTSAGSLLKVLDILLACGYTMENIVGAVCLVDREAGGRAALQQRGLRLTSLFTLTEILQTE